MKRFLFLFMTIMFLVIQGWSQTTLNESFEGVTFPPEDWTITTTSGGGNWENSTLIAHDGTKSAISAYASGGCTRWLITPKLSVSYDATTFAFWIATDQWYNDGDNIDILVSTTDNQTSSFSTISLLSLNQDSVTTTWKQYSVDLSTYIGQDIYVSIRVIDNYGFNTFIDDVTGPNLFVPTCPKPRNLTASNITTTDADLVWTDAAGSLWNIQYMPDTTNNWANATNILGVTSNAYTIQGLNPAVLYKTRVQTDCGTEQSEWSSPISFRSACGTIIQFPWIEGFENTWVDTIFPGNSTSPDCWITISNGGALSYNPYYTWSNSSLSYHSGSKSADMAGDSYNSSFNSDWLITPVLALTGGQMLNFYTKAYSNTYTVDISVYIYNVTTNGDLSSMADTANFVRIMSPETQTLSWLLHELSLSNYNGNYRIAFVRNSLPGGDHLFLDDVSVSNAPVCPNTYNLTASIRSATEVDLNWLQTNGNGSGWEIVYGDILSFDTLNAPNVSLTSTTAVPYTIQGLNPQTTYKFAVRQACGGNFSNIVTVETPAIASSLPYTTDFEYQQDNSMWSFINGNMLNKWYVGNAADTLGVNGLYISNDQGVTNTYTGTAISRVYAYRDFAVPAGVGELKLKFDWRSNGSITHDIMGNAHRDILKVYFLPLDANVEAGYVVPEEFNNLQIGDSLSQSIYWQTKEMNINTIQFPNLAGRTWRLLFNWNNESTDTNSSIQPPAAIDNLSLESVFCSRPSQLADSAITYNSTDLYWHESGQASVWIVEYKANYDTSWIQIQAQSNPYTLSGLISGTNYQVRVRSLCSLNDTSAVSNIISFQTACEPLNVPTPIETFFSAVPPSTCWTRMEGLLPDVANATLTSINYGWSYNSDITPHNAIYNTSYGNYWLISPSIDLGDGTSQAQLEFDIFFTAFNSSNAPQTGGTDDKFAVVISTDNGQTWNKTNATIWSNETGATRVLDNLTNVPSHIILPLRNSSLSPYTGIVKIGFYGESTVYNAYNYLHIDNIEVNPFSNCQRPSGVSATNLMATSATINFIENGASTSWEYVCGDTI